MKRLLFYCSFLVLLSCGSNKAKPKESKVISNFQTYKRIKDSSIHIKSNDTIKYKKLKSL